MLSGKRVHTFGEKVTCFPGRVSNRKICGFKYPELGYLKFDGCPKNGVCKKAPLRKIPFRGFIVLNKTASPHGGTLSSKGGRRKFLRDFPYGHTYLVILLLPGIGNA